MKKLLRRLCLALSLFIGSSGFVHAAQDPQAVRRAIEDFLRVQTKDLPGKSSYTIGTIDPNNSLQPCQAFDVSLPAGGNSWGRTTLSVRCLSEAAWKIYVPVHIRVYADYLVSARPLPQGHVLTANDITRQHGDLSDLPTGALLEPNQVIGRIVATPIAAGRPLRSNFLRQTPAVQQGQSVKLVTRGQGFQVSSEGRALNMANDGQIAQVRLANGQVVSGVARNGGIVEISY